VIYAITCPLVIICPQYITKILFFIDFLNVIIFFDDFYCNVNKLKKSYGKEARAARTAGRGAEDADRTAGREGSVA